RSRPRRTFLRRPPYHEPLPERLLRAAGLRLAEFRPVDRGWVEDRDGARQSDLETHFGGVHPAAARPRSRRSAGGIRGPAAGGGRRAPRVLDPRVSCPAPWRPDGGAAHHCPTRSPSGTSTMILRDAAAERSVQL